jgi:hypothetical protein
METLHYTGLFRSDHFPGKKAVLELRATYTMLLQKYVLYSYLAVLMIIRSNSI